MKNFEQELNGAKLKIAIVMSRFNLPICEGLYHACIAELKALGVAEEDIVVATVPGALEIPSALQDFAESQAFDALIALGAVVRGETYHFEIVSNESARAVTEVGLNYGIAIANAILTTNDDDQALARMVEKGTDAARVAIEMAHLKRRIRCAYHT